MTVKKLIPFKQKGSFLVEILVAVFLLAVLISAITPLLSVSYQVIMDGGRKSKTGYDTQQVLEERINNADYDETGDFKIFFTNNSGGSYTAEIGEVGIIEEDSLTYIKKKQ